MSNKLARELYRIAATTFEQLSFMSLAPTAENKFLKSEDDEWLMAVVAFSGPQSGRLCVCGCSQLTTALAENMLGEESVTEQQKRDALGEMANVICGNIVTTLAGPEAIFRIDSPQILPLSANYDLTSSNTTVVDLNFDEGRARLILQVD